VAAIAVNTTAISNAAPANSAAAAPAGNAFAAMLAQIGQPARTANPQTLENMLDAIPAKNDAANALLAQSAKGKLVKAQFLQSQPAKLSKPDAATIAAAPTDTAAATPSVVQFAAQAGTQAAAVAPAVPFVPVAPAIANPAPATAKNIQPAAALANAAQASPKTAADNAPGTAAQDTNPAQPSSTASTDTPTGQATATQTAAPQASALTQVAAATMRDFTNLQISSAQALPVAINSAAAKIAANTGGKQDNAKPDGGKSAPQLAKAQTPTNPQTASNTQAQSARSDALNASAQQPQQLTQTPVQPTDQSAAQASNAAAPISQTSQPVAATITFAPQVQSAPAQPDIGTLAVSIAAKSKDGAKQFDIRLDPPELGRVDVHLSVSTDGKTQATLSADKPQTLELLQRDSQHLERSLKDAGVDLSNNGLSFSLKGQDRQNDSANPARARARNLTVTAVAGTDAMTASNSTSLAPDSVRLDIRV
jgi:flagellar hook-length control protein FliK